MLFCFIDPLTQEKSSVTTTPASTNEEEARQQGRFGSTIDRDCREVSSKNFNITYLKGSYSRIKAEQSKSGKPEILANVLSLKS